VCHFIDLFVAVAGAPVTSIGATPLREGSHEAQTVMFSLTLGDGSIGTIHYLANSSRKLPKERFEVNSDGRTVVIDNFRGLKSFGFKKIKSRKLWSQQKGHRQCIEAFLGAVKGEKIELPSFEEIKNVTVATILAKESLRNGGVLVVGA
jgi:predicted dehydrogenase